MKANPVFAAESKGCRIEYHGISVGTVHPNQRCSALRALQEYAHMPLQETIEYPRTQFATFSP